MNPTMYIFVNSAIGMSPGKLAAQAAHAAVEAYRISNQPMRDAWYQGKHYKKLIMDGGDGFQLGVIQQYIEARGFASDLIIDEGRTEGTYFVPTALGVEIVDKHDPHACATFESFRTLREPKPEPDEPVFMPFETEPPPSRSAWWQSIKRSFR